MVAAPFFVGSDVAKATLDLAVRPTRSLDASE